MPGTLEGVKIISFSQVVAMPMYSSPTILLMCWNSQVN